MAWNDNLRTVQRYADNSYYTFSTGTKDNWHLMYHDTKGGHELYDKDYLSRIKTISHYYGHEHVYTSFVIVFDLVSKNAKETNGRPVPSQEQLDQIKKIAQSYSDDPQQIIMLHKLFDCFYMTMISEWYYKTTRGQPSKLKHRIKRLGVYQVIHEGMSPEAAANYSKHKSARDLDQEMKKHGF
ncbi:DUF7004 family protein [Levilactobacillus enshiensis]|uniref:DUF7004 family protein n=1 Tax=Levilactobacillus enshiensis TaxID=2590213 RepID=UPI00117A7C50|nr:hypothetical protein [Levilactobacillus enshiensis]